MKKKKFEKKKKSFINENLKVRIQTNVSFTTTTRIIHVTNFNFISLFISFIISFHFSIHLSFHFIFHFICHFISLFNSFIISFVFSSQFWELRNSIYSHVAEDFIWFSTHKKFHSWKHESSKKENIVTITFYAIISRLVSIFHRKLQSKRHFFDENTNSFRIDYDVYSQIVLTRRSQAIKHRALKISSASRTISIKYASEALLRDMTFLNFHFMRMF